MTKPQYNAVLIGQSVFAHFSNSYLRAKVIDKRDGKLLLRVERDGGKRLERWARYQSCELTTEKGTAAISSLLRF